MAATLAIEARDDRDDVLIAGCLSPFGWTYRPELAPPFDELWPRYAETAALQAPYVDLILCETMGAIMVNCSWPEAFAAAMPALATGSTRFGAYANGFGHIVDGYAPGSVTTVFGRRHDLDPAAYADIAMGWVGQGATIIGGCCEIGPEHIAELRRRLDAVGWRSGRTRIAHACQTPCDAMCYLGVS